MKPCLPLFAICAAALGQTAQPPQSVLLDRLNPTPSLMDQASRRIESMSLKGLVLPNKTPVPAVTLEVAETCAIPLLNALPARSSGEYTMQTGTQPVSGDPMGGAVGLPVCK